MQMQSALVRSVHVYIFLVGNCQVFSVRACQTEEMCASVYVYFMYSMYLDLVVVDHLVVRFGVGVGAGVAVVGLAMRFFCLTSLLPR